MRLGSVVSVIGNVIKNVMPFLITVMTLVTILLTLYYSQLDQAALNKPANSIQDILSDVPKYFFVGLLQVGHTQPVVAVLQGVNIATAVYALGYYFSLRDLSFFGKVIVVFVLFMINFIVYEQTHIVIGGHTNALSFTGSIVISGLYLLFFMVQDCILHYKSTDQRRRWYYGVSSFYVQAPSLGSLACAWSVGFYLKQYGVDESGSEAFLAGVTSSVMFVANLVLALLDTDWYFKSRLQITAIQPRLAGDLYDAPDFID
jgi:hypothetical protein